MRIALQGGDGLGGVGSAGADVNVAEAIEDGGKSGVDLERRFHQGTGAVIIFLEEEPLSGHIEDVFFTWKALQEVIHAGDSGEKIAVLNANHPASEELFVGSSTREKRFRFGKGGAIGHPPAGSEGGHGVGERGLRICSGGAARQSRGLEVVGVFVFVYGELKQLTGLLRMSGERDGAKELLRSARYARRAGRGVVGSRCDARRGSLRPGHRAK